MRTSPDTVFASTDPPIEWTVPSNPTSVCSTSRSSPSTATTASSPSIVSTSTSPAGIETSSSMGPGVWKRCSAISDRPNGGGGAEAARDGQREPVGGRDAGTRRGALDLAEHWLGQAHRERRLGYARGIVVDPVRVALRRCIAEHLRLLSAPAVAGETAAAAAGGRARLERAGEDLHEPRVDGEPFPGSGGVQPCLEAVGEAERDPRRERLVGGLGGRRPLVADEHELRVAAGEPNLDVSVVELT